MHFFFIFDHHLSCPILYLYLKSENLCDKKIIIWSLKSHHFFAPILYNPFHLYWTAPQRFLEYNLRFHLVFIPPFVPNSLSFSTETSTLRSLALIRYPQTRLLWLYSHRKSSRTFSFCTKVECLGSRELAQFSFSTVYLPLFCSPAPFDSSLCCGSLFKFVEIFLTPFGFGC